MLSNVPMVRAGDVLIVCVDKALTDAEAEKFSASVRAAMPGVQVAFMEKVTGLAVFRPEASQAGDRS